MKIRSDLEGVVYVQTEGGVACLAAGDTVPDGVDIGEHLTTEPEDLDTADESDAPDSEGADGSDDSDSDDDSDGGGQPDAGESPEDIEKGTEHARGRRGRRSTPGPGSDA